LLDTPKTLELNLEAWNNILLEKVWPTNNRRIRISTIDFPCEHSFISSPTIQVNETIDPLTGCKTYSFDNLCCDDWGSDYLVAVGPWCEPTYLQNTIEAEPWSPITVNRVGCMMRVGIDMPNFQDLDRKVSVDWLCDADFLKNTVEWWNWIIVEQNWCKMRFRIDPSWIGWERPRASRVLTTTYEVATTELEILSPMIWLNTSVEYKTWSWMLANANLLTVTKAWDYLFHFHSTVEINDAVYALRFEIMSTNNQRDWVCFQKYRWWNTSWTFELSWQAHPLTTAANWWLDIMTFQWTVLMKWLQVWDKFAALFRLAATYWPYTTHSQAKMRITGSNWTSNTPNLQWWPMFGSWFGISYIWPACV